MNKPGLPRNWQNVIWREWRNCEDEEYASYLFDLVADEPAGWVAVVILALLGALYGAIIGLLVGLIATNWETPSQPELWRLLWLTLLDYAWRGGCLGAAGLVIRMLGRQRLSWRKWLGMLTTAVPNDFFVWLAIWIVGGLIVWLGSAIGVWLGNELGGDLMMGVWLGNELGGDVMIGVSVGALAMLVIVLVGELGNSWLFVRLVVWLVIGLIVGLIAGLAALLLAVLGFRLGFALGFVLGIALGIGLVVAPGIELAHWPDNFWPFVGLGVWLVVWLVVGLGVWLVVWLIVGLDVWLVVWLIVWLGIRAEETTKNNMHYNYHLWWFWWRKRPYTAETEYVLRQVADQQLNARHIWGELLQRIETQRQSRLSPDKLIAALQAGDWRERFVVRHTLVTMGDNFELLIRALGDKNKAVRRVVAQSLGQLGDSRAVKPLNRTLGDENDDVCQAATQAIRTICEKSQRLLGRSWSDCVCTEHLNRFTHWRVSLSIFEETGYYACRICQADQPRYEAVSDVVLVLDDQATDPAPVQQENILYIPWSLARGIFDFNAVEIRAAASSNIERFLVQFEEDTDPARPWKLESAGKLPCRVSPGCTLSPADRARLQRHFEIREPR